MKFKGGLRTHVCLQRKVSYIFYIQEYYFLAAGKLSLDLDELLKWIGEREKELASDLPNFNSWNVKKLKKTLVPYIKRMEVSGSWAKIRERKPCEP